MGDIGERYSFCGWCQKAFRMKRKWQKFCCWQCRWKRWDHDNPRVKRVTK